MRTSILAAGGMLSAAVLCGVLATGEEPRTNPPQPKTASAPAAAGVISPQENDQRIIRWIAVDNLALIECSDMAHEHSSNEQIKGFARMIVNDHRKFEQSLGVKRDAANFFNREKTNAPDRKPANGKTATLIQDDGRSRDGAILFRPTDFVEVKEKVCDDLRSQAKEQFEALKGSEFDHAYLAHMEFGHQAMIATIDVVKGNASSDLRGRLESFQALARKHLEQVRDLQNDVRGNRTAARDSE